jgi:hypothetical protein
LRGAGFARVVRAVESRAFQSGNSAYNTARPSKTTSFLPGGTNGTPAHDTLPIFFLHLLPLAEQQKFTGSIKSMPFIL